MAYSSCKAWIAARVKMSYTKRSRSESKSVHAKGCSCYYMLSTVGVEDAFLCKILSMYTLGFTADKLITTALSTSLDGTSRVTVATDT